MGHCYATTDGITQAIRPSAHQAISPSGHQPIRSSAHQAITPLKTGSMSLHVPGTTIMECPSVCCVHAISLTKLISWPIKKHASCKTSECWLGCGVWSCCCASQAKVYVVFCEDGNQAELLPLCPTLQTLVHLSYSSYVCWISECSKNKRFKYPSMN